ncbi:uncharacterized protein LOC141612419 [Silene latifolia]|uniref:uncharacterized protein LOC141612419 n=1 Tax=Silene latifolia TaxID=37657 RepID=UPI003D77A52B
MLFYLGFPQYENEEFWAYLDRLVQFLDSLDEHDFSEEELRLTIEKGMNSQVKFFLDSLCDGDLSSKSDDEAYNLFDWLNRESRKPNFSLPSIEENTIVDVGESVEDVGEKIMGVSKGVVEIEQSEDVLEERLEIEEDRPLKQFEVETPFFEDEPYTTFEDINITFPTTLATPTDNEDALFEDYESKSDEESIMFEDLEVKWDDEFLEEEIVSFDGERDCEVHLLDEPIYEKFEASFCGEDEYLIPTDDIDLISYAPLLEIMYDDEEYDAPLLDKACMGDLLETPLPYTCDDYDAFPSLLEKFVFEMDEWRGEARDNDTNKVSYVVDCPLLVGFDHSPPMKEEIFYVIEFENVEENDHNLDDWKRLKDVSFIDLGKELSGLAHRLWDPG